ncbi:MAG: hypothetical protein J6033_03125 [Lachnospiraceae bacterium]|nr:hypothetical protein [Lachnospiraceae bacterium]
MSNYSVYEDNKYCIQEISTLFLGVKYTLSEILDDENIPAKLQIIFQRYILEDADPEDTLETNIYYLQEKSPALRVYRQLKCKVKVNVLEEKKSLFKGKRTEYVTKVVPVDTVAAMSLEEKQRIGLVVSEISISKLAMMAF